MELGNDGYVWIMIHSGSRNLGYTVANHYIKIAKDLNLKWHSNINPKSELFFLPINSIEGQFYIKEMNLCVEFSKANHNLMMKNIQDSILNIFPDIEFSDKHFISHNYAALENHFGKNVWVHRKGAVRARKEDICLIPGSQGTSSFICKGKGNRDSFNSCSHGAGRNYSRTKAINELDYDKEKAILDNQGIIHTLTSKSKLDESTSAYKDIYDVMKNQEDLVDILVELKPLAVVKG